MIDAYIVSNLQESLDLTDDQFVKLLPLVKRLQTDRRDILQRRQRALMELRRLLASGGATEARVTELLREVKTAEAEEPAILRKDRDAIDGVLSPVQQAKFRVLEVEVERKIRELMGQIRSERPQPGAVAAAHAADTRAIAEAPSGPTGVFPPRWPPDEKVYFARDVPHTERSTAPRPRTVGDVAPRVTPRGRQERRSSAAVGGPAHGDGRKARRTARRPASPKKRRRARGRARRRAPQPRPTPASAKKSRSSPRSTSAARRPHAGVRGGAVPLPGDLRRRPRAPAGEGSGVALRVLGRRARESVAARCARELGERGLALSRLTLRVTDPGHGGDVDHPAPVRRARLVRAARTRPRARIAPQLGLTLPSGEFRTLAESNTVVDPARRAVARCRAPARCRSPRPLAEIRARAAARIAAEEPGTVEHRALRRRRCPIGGRPPPRRARATPSARRPPVN